MHSFRGSRSDSPDESRSFDCNGPTSCSATITRDSSFLSDFGPNTNSSYSMTNLAAEHPNLTLILKSLNYLTLIPKLTKSSSENTEVTDKPHIPSDIPQLNDQRTVEVEDTPCSSPPDVDRLHFSMTDELVEEKTISNWEKGQISSMSENEVPENEPYSQETAYMDASADGNSITTQKTPSSSLERSSPKLSQSSVSSAMSIDEGVDIKKGVSNTPTVNDGKKLEAVQEIDDSLPSSSPPSSSPSSLFPSSPLPSSQPSDFPLPLDVETCDETEDRGTKQTSSNNEESIPVDLMEPESPLPSSSPVEAFASPRAEFRVNLPRPATGIEFVEVKAQLNADTLGIESPTSAASSSKRKVDDTEDSDSPTPKRVKREGRSMNANQLTFTELSQRQKTQRDKLIAPFRSPIVLKESPDGDFRERIPSGFDRSKLLELRKAKPLPKISEECEKVEGRGRMSETTESVELMANSVRTKRAAKQFKSPLAPGESSKQKQTTVRQTPTIQALERKIQVLRRAVKVKAEGEAEMLKTLTRKWTEAGREVAWEVWGLVKDRGRENDGGPKIGEKRRFEESWGWESNDGKKGKIEGGSWGWDDGTANRGEEGGTEGAGGKEEEAEEEKPEATLGTMLRHLGVDPQTLGWDEDEGTFVDS